MLPWDLCMYSSAHAFRAHTSLSWQTRSEMDVHKVQQRSYVKIAVLRIRNARECHAELREAWVFVPVVSNIFKVGTGTQKRKSVNGQHSLPQWNHKTMIINAWSLLACYQWLLNIYSHLLVKFTGTCHAISNLYAPFIVFPHFRQKKKKSCCNLWSDIEIVWQNFYQ
jgi:hypothetical protein